MRVSDVVQIAHVHARPQVLLGEALQAAARRGGHRRALSSRSGRRDELAERAVEDGRLEPVEGVADVGEEPQVHTELGERLERAQRGGGDQGATALDEARQQVGVQAAGALLGARRVLRLREPRAVPGRVTGAVAELPELGGLHHGLGRGAAIGREQFDGLPAEACPRGRRRGQEREPTELGDAVEHADAEHRVGACESLAVVEQYAAEAHERFVDLDDTGPLRLLVATDRADEVAAQRRRGRRDAGQADVGEPLRDAAQGRPARAHDEHALVLRDEGAERVDDGLRAAGAGERLDDERGTRRDRRDDLLLLGIGVEEQQVGPGRALIGVHGYDRLAALLHGPARARVARDRVEDGMPELVRVRRHRRTHLGEGRDHEARRDREAL